MLVAQGNRPNAWQAFNAALAVDDRLAKAAPANAGWQKRAQRSSIIYRTNSIERRQYRASHIFLSGRGSRLDPTYGNSPVFRIWSICFDSVKS